jgi:hypothetical protein
MSVWVLHQALSAQEEDSIEQHDRVVLPFNGVPDLSEIAAIGQIKSILSMLHPDMPPESVSRMAERYWTLYQGLAVDDVIAVPLPYRREVALAQISGRYSYEVGAAGEDIHAIAVTWQRRVPFSRLGKHAALFTSKQPPMFEVPHADERNAIRSWLPHRYNRFARWKWLVIVLMVFQTILFVTRQWQQ